MLPITVTSSADSFPEVSFQAMSFSSGLSELDEIRLTITTDANVPEIEWTDVLDKIVTIKATSEAGTARYIAGHAIQLALGSSLNNKYSYNLILRPWLWFLKRRTDYRVFQNQNVKQIVKSIFDNYSTSSYSFDNVTTDYPTLEYCIQYNETDYDFVTRLLAYEGIYWYFDYTETGYQLILIDSIAKHKPCSGYTEINFHEDPGHARSNEEFIYNCNFAHEIRSDSVKLGSYNLVIPSTKLLPPAPNPPFSTTAGNLEHFVYTGDYVDDTRAKQLGAVRLDEEQADRVILEIKSNVQGFRAGYTFKLTGHQREALGAEYLLISHTIDIDLNASAKDQRHGLFRCVSKAIPSSQQFRSRRLQKPTPGLELAKIVGGANKEIETDDYGRVKIQFIWDRYGQNDANSSCFVSVSQAWASKGFGVRYIPRINDLVIVYFLNKDPDKPVVIGCLHNGDQMPPWGDQANRANMSGVLSKSTTNGATDSGNQLRFDDTKGSEEMSIVAQLKQNVLVKGDRQLSVLSNDATAITKDQTIDVQGDTGRTTTIKNADSLQAKTIVVEGSDSIEFKCGGGSIKMTNDGTIELKGVKITIEGSSDVSVESTGTQVSILGFSGAKLGANTGNVLVQASSGEASVLAFTTATLEGQTKTVVTSPITTTVKAPIVGNN